VEISPPFANLEDFDNSHCGEYIGKAARSDFNVGITFSGKLVWA
jgi:hypothetical protein